jgi:hypothetical protein
MDTSEWILIIVIFALFAMFVVKTFYFNPAYPRVGEGFYGGVARSAGHPDCLRTLPEGAKLLDMVSKRVKGYPSDGSTDYKEMELLLSKMACLKKDLLSPSGIVNATRHQAYETSHDQMAVAELCGMCMSHTISPRDLDIATSTWRDRGKLLLRKLCTEANLTEMEVVDAETLFKRAFDDVYDVATSRCLKPTVSMQDKGDVSGYMPENIKDRRTYEYKYGGLSASGWNGSV